MTYLRSSNTPPFPSPERPAACSLPIALTRPSRHSSRHCPCGARWHATFTGDFRLRGDTRTPHRPLRGARRRRRKRPCKAGPRPVLPNLCASRLSARPDRLRGVPGHGTLNRDSRRFAQSDRSSRGSEDEQERTRLPRRRRDVRDQGQRRAHGGGRVLRHRRRPRAGRTRRHRGLKDAVVQGGEGPSRRGQRIAWGAKRPGACRSSRQRLRRRCTPSPCIGVEALGLENGSFPCACVRPIYEPALHASRGRPTHFTPRAIGLPTGPTRWGAGRLGQERSSTSGTRCPSPPCGSLSGSLDPRESGQHRRPPTSGDLRGYPATATLGGSHHRTPGVRIPSLVRLSASGLEFRCFQMAYGDFRCLDGRMVGVGTRASQDWAIRGRVRRLGRRIPRTGPTSVFTDTAVGQFALDATNVTSSILLSRELKSPGSVEGPNYVSDSHGRAGKR